MPKDERNRAVELLQSVDPRLLEELPQAFDDNTIRIERLPLELIRPDPVQPRRVLPERIHFEFHGQRLTPHQALRELVQIAQIAARQNGRPFTSVLDLLPNADDDRPDSPDGKLTPEEALLRDLVSMALTLRDDGLVNALTVVDISEGVMRLYRIETGERRYWAAWLLRDFIPGYESDGMIECRVVSHDRTSVFRQAKENTARHGLNAVALARQAALLILSVNGYEIPPYAVGNDYYRQALELRIPRGSATEIYAAMGGIDKRRFSQYKDLLNLSDEALEYADRHSLDEGVLRHLLKLSPDDQLEMMRQIVQFNLSGKQVESIIEQGFQVSEDQAADNLPPYLTRFAKAIVRDVEKVSPDLLWLAVLNQHGDPHLAQAYLRRIAELAFSAASRYSEST